MEFNNKSMASVNVGNVTLDNGDLPVPCVTGGFRVPRDNADLPDTTAPLTGIKYADEEIQDGNMDTFKHGLTEDGVIFNNSTDKSTTSLSESEEKTADADHEETVHSKELLCKDYDIKTKTDTGHFEISGITLISENKNFVTCDHGNQIIKLVDGQFNVISKHNSVFQPWDVTYVSAGILVVSFPFVRLLQYLKLKGSSHVVPWYPLLSGNEYYGLAYDRNRIVAICKYDGTQYVPSVHVIDRQGNIEHTICPSKNGKALLVDPGFISVNGRNHMIFVSDQGSQSVLSMTQDGNILGTFSKPGFQPMGLSVESMNGTVFVCDRASDSVLILSSELQSIQRIIAKYEEMPRPLAVCFCDRTEQLLVTMEGLSVVRAFRL